MQINLPSNFEKYHEQALTAYLSDNRMLTPALWERLYEAIDILGQAQVTSENRALTFQRVFTEQIDQPFADEYIDKLLTLKSVSRKSPGLAATFARQIGPRLEASGYLRKDLPQSWLLLTYCLYWWQSFARGYAFEVEVMHDLEESGVTFQMHDIRVRVERFSQADLIVLGLLGDIKTSTYFLQQPPKSGNLPNDFYLTRLFDKGRKRTLVVFQKPFAWEAIGGGDVENGSLEDVLLILPQPVQLEQYGIILVVVEYETWKKMVLQKQLGTGE